MFSSISFNDKVSTHDGLFILTYLLEDTEFTVKLDVSIEPEIYNNRGDASIIPSGLINFYTQRHKNIPKNLALFYNSTLSHIPVFERKNIIKLDQLWSDTYFPYIQYKKYYNCVCNQLYVMNFSGKYK